ncbi:MAG: hypothetical protein D3925_18080 [Candidatus Electrothrix sp. AR5]|nr:hypothetical protein [Candidatus Electrothrix sp. AR5]
MKTVKPAGNELDNALKKNLLIWKGGLVFLAVCFTVAFILHLLNVQIEVTIPFPSKYLTYGLLGVAALDILALFLVRKKVLKTDDKVTEEVPRIAAIRYTNATLVTTAILSSIGIYGLVDFVVTRDVITLLMFLAIAASGMLLFRPNKDTLTNLAHQLRR